MKKSLIIGAFTNYNFNQLKPWVDSINQSGFTGDRVLIAVNADIETVQALRNNNFGVMEISDPQPKIPIHVMRFVHIYEYLSKVWESYEYVITTDVKDVIFQYDPVTWLQINLGNKKMVAGSESILYKDEPWGNENLMQAYGPYVHNMFKNNTIYNVGTLGGESEYIKDICLTIALNSTNRPIPIVDQAVFNVLLALQPYKDNTFFAPQYEGWACQAGTTADPSKIEAFRPNLLEAEPIYDNGVVKIAQGHYTGEPFCIVHQYDRVPEWKKMVIEKYGQLEQVPQPVQFEHPEFFSYKV
jgi:hypothetical protein